MTHRLSLARLRVLGAGGVAAVVLAAAVVAVTSASAATTATVSCKGISFRVLHNDTSGGVTLPAGSYLVSSSNLSCSTASSYFHNFLDKYNGKIPGWTGKQIAVGYGTYTKTGTKTSFTVKKSSSGVGSPPPAGGCVTSALKVSLGKANATAGTTFYPLKFVNTSKTSCTLRGYPGVSAVGKKGQQIGNAAKRIASKYRTVTLAPGKQQSSSVGIIDTGNFKASRCKPVKASGMKVFAPNTTKAVTLKKKFSTCSSKASTSLQVRPVK